MKWFIILLLAVGTQCLVACVATENGFIMKTADPAWGVRFTFPAPPLVSHDPQPLPGEVGESEDPEIAATPSCEMIKGNINSKGDKIYHTADSPNYNQTLIDESKGEAFFCSEEEAVTAGFRKAGG